MQRILANFRNDIIQKWYTHASGLWGEIFIPFLFTRTILFFTGWLSRYLPFNDKYPIQNAVSRGWHFSPYRLLDIWARWDSGWYLNIVLNGYMVKGDLTTVQSNLAFFPLFPYVVRWIAWLPSHSLKSINVILLIGVLTSNICLLAGLVFLWKIVKANGWSDEIAGRSIKYLLYFPTAFFFSCFYTESLFLFLSLAAFYAAIRHKWALAGLLGALLGITRPNGVIFFIPLSWLYLDAIDWDYKQIHWNSIWLLMVPLGLLVHLLSIYPITNNFFAPIMAQSAWGKSLNLPWNAWIESTKVTPMIAPFDLFFTLGFLLMCFFVWHYFRSKSYVIFSLLMLIPLLFSGSIQSNMRYVIVIFPVFIALAKLSQRRWFYSLLKVTFLGLQVIFMAAWCQFYWVG